MGSEMDTPDKSLDEVRRLAFRYRIFNLISAILLAAVAGAISVAYAFTAGRVAELTEKFSGMESKILEVAREAEAAKSNFVRLQSEMGELVAQLEDARKSQERLSNTMIGRVHSLESRISESQDGPSLQTKGWVYVGEYNFEARKWTLVNFANLKNLPPNRLKERNLVLASEGLNVRNDILIGKVITSLVKGDSVKVEEVKEYPNSPYVWALISHKK